MPVCPSASELCEVAEVSNDGSLLEVPSCADTPAERCFEVVFDECPNGEAWIRLPPEASAVELVVNCPPPESDESNFDCAPP